MSELSSVSDFSCPCPKDDYYDVFISFRGPDTRSGFTDNLYRALLESKVHTFIDTNLAGSAIETLFKIIVKSRMAVVVYSETFASSKWCLKELETIMRRSEEKKMFVLPVFYKVNTQELKHPTENTTKYFDEHIINNTKDEVEKWKNAVIKIGNVSGFPYKDIYGRSEHDFIVRDIIPNIQKKLKEWEEPLESTINPYSQGPEAEYDVFISFMGKDTRYSLVSHLYNALILKKKKIFMDDQDHLKDETTVFELIQRSKMAVVFFSENYTSSTWCLRELVEILQCSRDTTRQLMVLPIFYEVAPSDLRNQPEDSRITYHLNKHVHDEESETIQSWRNAIADLGHMDVDGWRYAAGHSKKDVAYFIRDLAENISTRVDEKMESIRNQQAHVLAKEPLAAQTDSLTSSPSSVDGVFGASVSVENSSGDVADVAVDDGQVSSGAEVEGGIEDGSSELELEISDHEPLDDDQVSSGAEVEGGIEDGSSELELEISDHEPIDDDQVSSGAEIEGGIEDGSSELELEISDHEPVDDDDQNLAISPIPHLRQEDITQSFQHTNTATGEEEVYHVVTSGYFQKLDEIMGEKLTDNFSDVNEFFHGSKQVISIDTHPTKPWLLLSMYSQSAYIWNYETQAEEKSFKVDYSYVTRANFIHGKNWIVAGDRDGFVHVFDYGTSKKMKMFQAHNDSIECVAVHPTSPYVLTASKDKLIKLWNWKKNWVCIQTFKGHWDHVVQVAFNPRDSRSFASVSRNGAIQIWRFDLSFKEFMIEEDNRNLSFVEYFVGNDNKLYLLTGCGSSIKVWDYDSKTLIQIIEGHSGSVTSSLVHPKLPIIITGSEDKTIHIWNKKTNRLEFVWCCDLGQVWSIKFIQVANKVVIGCEEGIVVIKIVDTTKWDVSFKNMVITTLDLFRKCLDFV